MRRWTCGAAVLAVLAVSLSSCALTAPLPATEIPVDNSIPWSQAHDFVGTTQRVCGPLAAIGHDDDDVFVNIGFEYPDPRRFTIVVWDVGSIDPIDVGTTVCATGELVDYKGVAEIQLRSSEQIELP